MIHLLNKWDKKNPDYNEIAKKLIFEASANIYLNNKDGHNALYYAEFYKNKQAIEMIQNAHRFNQSLKLNHKTNRLFFESLFRDNYVQKLCFHSCTEKCIWRPGEIDEIDNENNDE